MVPGASTVPDGGADAEVEAEVDIRSFPTPLPARSRVYAFSGAWRLSRLILRFLNEDIYQGEMAMFKWTRFP